MASLFSARMNEVAINIATFENVTRFLDNESVGKIVKALIMFSNGESEEYCQNTLDNGLKSAFSILAAEENERMKKRKDISSKRGVAGRRGMASRWGKRSKDVDYESLMEYFNREVCGTRIPQIQRITGKRKAMVSARVRQFGKQAIQDVIQKTVRSRFLTGEDGGFFTATFDWLFKEDNFQKVLEGNYKNRENGVSTQKEKRQQEYIDGIISIAREQFSAAAVKPLP